MKKIVRPILITEAVNPVDFAMAITKASMHQAVASSIAAQANAVLPSGDLERFRSSSIRASTGNAVMLIAIPMNSAKAVKDVLAGANVG